MTEIERFQRHLLNKPAMPPWRRLLIIAFGILLPVFFVTVGCWFIIASPCPLWVKAIGAILGLGWAIVGSTFNLLAPNSRKMRSWLGGIFGATLGFTLLWAIPRHPASLAFTAGYGFSFVFGVSVGLLSFNAVAARLRT
jgi:hypothetical protein